MVYQKVNKIEILLANFVGAKVNGFGEVLDRTIHFHVFPNKQNN